MPNPSSISKALNNIYKNWGAKEASEILKRMASYKFTSQEVLDLEKVGFNADLFYKNFLKYVGANLDGKLLLDNFYHKALSPEDIVYNEFPLMGMKETPVPINEQLFTIFNQEDCYPRLMKALEDSHIKLSKKSKSEIISLFSNIWEELDIKYGYVEPGTLGHSKGIGKIRYMYGQVPLDRAVQHELHHSIRNRLAHLFTFSREKDLDISQISLNPARKQFQLQYPEYTPSELKILKEFKFSKEDLKDVTPTSELGAVISESRFLIYKDKLENNPSFKGQLSDLDIIDYVNKNGAYNTINHSYGRSFVNSFKLEAAKREMKEFPNELLKDSNIGEELNKNKIIEALIKIA